MIISLVKLIWRLDVREMRWYGEKIRVYGGITKGERTKLECTVRN